MEMIRNVLIIDDSKNIQQDIESYNFIFQAIKADKKLEYQLNIESEKIYENALSLLKSSEKVFDVLLIDFDLSLEAENEKTGIQLVHQIRREANRNCKIIFYTMGELSSVFNDRMELVKLFNAGVYRLLPKDMPTESPQRYGLPALQLRVESIIEAINDLDFIQIALERYFAQYKDIIEDEKIIVNGHGYSINELITLIRQDKDTGRIYKSNLAESVVIHNILSAGGENQ